jgi:hypothetical protein
MPDPAACIRRIYRLSALLTLDVPTARKVLHRILHTAQRIDRIDSAHLDRLTILGCREAGTAHPATLAIASEGLDRLAALPRQPREAWVLSRVYRVPLREMARSMDCSTTATMRHLEQADHQMADLADREGFVAELLRFTMALDAPAVEIKRRQRRLRWRRMRPWLALLIILGVLLAAFVSARTWYAGLVRVDATSAVPGAPSSGPGAGDDASATSQ